jgi:hypothetical protein
MDQSSPLTALSGLLDATVSTLERLAVASDDGVIALTSTLAVGMDRRYLVLSYSQQGLRVLPLASRGDLRWDGELEEGERLELVPLEAGAEVPELPLRVERIEGWVGYGRYDDVLAFALSGPGGQLVVTTTSDDLLCTTPEDAGANAELTARHSGLTLRREHLTSTA